MKNISCYFVHALLLLSAIAPSNEVTAAGAGVLIFAEVDDIQYVLLADHKHPMQARGWGILAGIVEKNESTLDAAVRETVEESNGAFDEAALRNTINSKNNIHENDFTTYFAKTKFEPATVYSYIVVNVDQGVNGERGPFAWIPWAIVSDAAKEVEELGDACRDRPVMIPPEYLPETRQTSWFFCPFLGLAITIDKKGGLPESNKTLQRTSR